MSTSDRAAPRVCTRTGLVLTASCRQRVFRVASKGRGPFNPPPRAEATSPEELSRWDTPGRTIYAGSAERGALIEVLSYITPDETSSQTMTDAFDDVELGDELFVYEQIAKELAQHGAMAARSVSKGWREARNIYEFRLPANGWFVDITASDSVGAVDEHLRAALGDKYGIDELHISHLTDDGADARAVTAHIAKWVRGQVLDDGSLSHGIVYPSKYGTDLENYAIWLRRRDDGVDTGIDPLERVGQYAIHKHTTEFQKAISRLKLKAY